MPTKTYKFSGFTRWAKVRKPDEKYENWQVPLYMDKASWVEYKKSGCQLDVKTDSTDGEKYVVFKRKIRERDYRQGGVEVDAAPPQVFKKEGDTYVLWPDGLIGNGSKVTVRVDIFDTRNGPGHRLISVGIDDLVEYNPPPKDGDKPFDMPF